MKPKTMIMMGVAVVFGLLASWMTTKLWSDSNLQVKVLVAKDKVPQYTTIREPESLFEAAEKKQAELPPNAMTEDKLGELKGRQMKNGLGKGGVLKLEDLQDPIKSGLDSQLPKGKRAFSIPITADSAVGGFVVAGTNVDVVWVPREQNQQSTPKVVLENVLVRAIDLASNRPEDKPGMIGAVATLEVDPKQMVELARYRNTGSLYLALRPSGDDGESTVAQAKPKEEEYTPKDVSQPPAPIVEQPIKQPNTGPAPAPPEEKVAVMTVINGSSWTENAYKVNSKGAVTGFDTKQSPRSEAPKPEPKPETKSDSKPASGDADTKKSTDQTNSY